MTGLSLCVQNAHVPYRDSKLTFLLQDSLMGQSKTYVQFARPNCLFSRSTDALI